MKNKIALILWIGGFILLNLYANLIPKLFQFDPLPWLGWAVGFFVVAFLLAKYVLQLKGLQSFGMQLHRGWGRNLLIGFILGFGIWGLKNLVFYSMGKFEVTGMMDASYIYPMLALALLGMFFASAINDLMIRGYSFAFCKKENQLRWYLIFATVLYTLDDSWNEGFDIMNLGFSAVLGISLAYTVVKTGSIWMAIGIHWGSNMMFRVMSGFDGQGVWQLDNMKDGFTYELISIVITALLFPVLYFLLRNRKANEIIPLNKPSETPEFA
ncbi:CPBP family intramembrane glutamic endopeptidase [Pontibacter vulgaris]|uniref:CPBP family intramembrane glutamic endopeptidase n=1 Tax=Pontibacter vulgaris TaxID=2905679 RepID=UPI001FA74E7C|nr:CPBP family intramembrane glutamic endopeptidase [Pontibacter vulgaris]